MKTIRETPDNVIVQLVEECYLTDDISFLEPSAGEGKIIDFIKTNYTRLENFKIDAIELNKEKYDILKEKCNAYHLDFLTFDPERKYDRIIACPPFKKNIDTVHIIKMYSMLNKGGILVSLTSPFWTVNNEEHQVNFRSWLSDKEYYFKMLPDNSFIEKYKSVPVAMLKIFKK